MYIKKIKIFGIICPVLVSLLLNSLFAFSSFAADKSIEFYASESFDNYVTNITPAFEGIVGKNVYISENEPGISKALMMKTKTKNTGFSYTLSKPASRFVWSFDIKSGFAVANGKISVKNSAGAETVVIQIKPSGRICTYDERIIGGISPDRNVHIDMTFDLVNSRYSVYINSKKAVSDWYISENSPAVVSSVSYLFKGENKDTASEVLIDNLYIYSGNEILSDEKLPKKKFVAGANERNDIEEGGVGSAVYFNRTYDEGSNDFAGMTVYAKENKISVEGDDNKYLNMIKYVASDCLFDISTKESGEYMMVEFDISSDNPGNTSIYFRDTKGIDLYLLKIDLSGRLTLFDGTVVTKLQSGKWVNIAIALDFEEKKYSIYADKRIVFKNVGFSDIRVSDMNFFRVQILDSNSTNIKLDNFKIYDGVTFKNLTGSEEVVFDDNSIMPTYSDVAQKLGGSVALHLYGGTILRADGKKLKLDNPPYIKEDRTLVPVRAVSEGFGFDVTWDAENKKVMIGSIVEMTVGEKSMTVNGKRVDLGVAPEIKNGAAYLPLRALAEEALGKNVFWDEHGLIVISDDKLDMDPVFVSNANNYMLYDRPTATEITEKFNKTSGNVHPRVMLTSEKFNSIKSNYNAGGIMKKWGDKVIFMADSYLKTAPKQFDPSVTSGTDLLPIPQAIKNRIEALAMAYILTNDIKYAERAWEELETAGNFPGWVTEHFLNTSEYMTAFAIGYDWLYSCWTDAQKSFLENAMMKKGLNYALSGYYGEGAWWAKETINWNLVCNGGSICAAVALMDVYPDVCSKVIENALRGMEFALASYYPDGAWSEGIGYWEFATEFFVRACSSLDATFKEDFNISKAPGISKTAETPIYANGYVAANNYHDAGEVLYMSPLLFWLADKYDAPAVAKIRYEEMESYDLYPSTLDMILCNTSQLDSNSDFALDKYFRGSEAVSMRSSWSDNSGTYISFHGGKADENHGHVDSGTFVIDMLGERIASDLGAESYSHPKYFSDERYTLYRARPEGHNMVVINPDKSEGISLTSVSKVETLESKERGAFSVLNLDDAYKAYASSYKRGYKLEDDRRSVVIRDEMCLKKSSTAYWFMHTKADVKIVDNNTAILTINSKKFLVRFKTNAKEFILSDMDAKPLDTSPVVENQADNSQYTKLALKFKSDGDTYIEVKIIPYDDPASREPMSDLPIANWSVPDGKMSRLPKADMIYTDGDVITVFDKAQNSYRINVPTGSGVPKVTADVPEDCYCEVTDAQSLSETSVIKVINKNNHELYSYYYIGYREIFVNNANDGIDRIKVKNVIASENPQEENMDVNVIDGDLNTRWSAEGLDQWVMLDFGEQQKLNAFGIATYNGEVRTLSYSVDVSDDAIEWKNIYIGTTSLTNEIEVIHVPETTARYVRLNCYGNSVNNWNSITEFACIYK